MAGITKADAAPFTADSAASRGMVAVPENSRAAVVPIERMSMT
jgi:hypothetical protein